MLHPFAVGGATCSNNLTDHHPFPSVFEGQLPKYFGQVQNGTLSLNPEETVYTLWIGTNDVGSSTLTTGQQVPGVTLVDVIQCPLTWIERLYAAGARNFVIQNVHLLLILGESVFTLLANVDVDTTTYHSILRQLIS